MKKIEEITTGWIINRLHHEKNPENFDFICYVLSQRLINRKRFYHSPFPDGSYKVYLYVEHNTFGAIIYKSYLDDEKVKLSKNFEYIGTLSILIKGNDIVDVYEFESENPSFLQEIARRVLNLMGLYIHLQK